MSAPFKEFSVWRTGSYPAKFVIKVEPVCSSSMSKEANAVAKFIASAIREKLERENK